MSARWYVSKHGENLRFHISCTQKPWMWTPVLRRSMFWVPYRWLAGHLSSSFSRSDRCHHLNSVHLQSPTARPPSCACNYYTSAPKGRRRCFSVTVAKTPWPKQQSSILHLFFAGPRGGLTPFHTGGRQWRQTEGLREHPSHLSALITIQCGVKALPPFVRNNHPPSPSSK